MEQFQNLPEARQRAATQVVGSQVIGESISKMMDTVEALKEYAANVIHPMFNDNRSANLVAQCEAAKFTLRTARNQMSQANAQLELIQATLNEYSPE
jgi:hypothetical protein